VRPGGAASVDVASKYETTLRRHPDVTDPLRTLVGRGTRRLAVPTEELGEGIDRWSDMAGLPAHGDVFYAKVTAWRGGNARLASRASLPRGRCEAE